MGLDGLAFPQLEENLSFCLDVVKGLVGLFHSWKLTGCCRSDKYFNLQRMDLLREEIYAHGSCMKMYTVQCSVVWLATP